MVPNHTLPLRHLDRMHLVFPCNLSNRLDAHQGFQSHLGLEGAHIPFPFSFAHSSAVLSCPAEPEKSNLATGPNYGVHFSPTKPEAASTNLVWEETACVITTQTFSKSFLNSSISVPSFFKSRLRPPLFESMVFSFDREARTDGPSRTIFSNVSGSNHSLMFKAGNSLDVFDIV